jgi:hypothetical protein
VTEDVGGKNSLFHGDISAIGVYLVRRWAVRQVLADDAPPDKGFGKGP